MIAKSGIQIYIGIHRRSGLAGPASEDGMDVGRWVTRTTAIPPSGVRGAVRTEGPKVLAVSLKPGRGVER